MQNNQNSISTEMFAEILQLFPVISNIQIYKKYIIVEVKELIPSEAGIAQVSIAQTDITQAMITKEIRRILNQLSAQDFVVTFSLQSKIRHEIMQNKAQPQQKAIVDAKAEDLLLTNSCNIAVLSLKGGVGKSSLTYHLAHAYAQANPNIQTAILDLDIYGPTQHFLAITAIKQQSDVNVDNTKPIKIAKNLSLASIGLLLPNDKALLWRGLMVSKAVKDLCTKIDWTGVQVIFIDTPPGSGEVHLTLLKHLQLYGVINVTTLSPVAMQADLRMQAMLNILDTKIIAKIINMTERDQVLQNLENNLYPGFEVAFRREIFNNEVTTHPSRDMVDLLLSYLPYMQLPDFRS